MSATNWTGNVTFRTRRRDSPADLSTLQRLVATSPRVRALGTGHSFSPIADTGGFLVSLAGLARTVESDRDRRIAELAGR